MAMRCFAWMSGLALLGSTGAFSQDYPNHPIRMLVSGVGSGADFVARLIAQKISVPLGQPVIIENRPAGPSAGVSVAKSPPDGYMLNFGGPTFTITPLLQDVPY